MKILSDVVVKLQRALGLRVLACPQLIRPQAFSPHKGQRCGIIGHDNAFKVLIL